MGIWSYDLWASDDALEVVRALAVQLGLLRADRLKFKMLQMSPVGSPRIYIGRYTPDEHDLLLDIMDTKLTPAMLDAIDPVAFHAAHFAEDEAAVAKEVAAGRPSCGLNQGGEMLALWALLCMHVGARVPEVAKVQALRGLHPRGRRLGYSWGWADRDEAPRKEIAAVVLAELQAYDCARGGAPVRFPPEPLVAVLARGGNRYDDLAAAALTGARAEPRRKGPFDIVVLRGCASCRVVEHAAATHLHCAACCGAGGPLYCGKACQRAHWAAGHRAQCRSRAGKSG